MNSMWDNIMGPNGLVSNLIDDLISAVTAPIVAKIGPYMTKVDEVLSEVLGKVCNFRTKAIVGSKKVFDGLLIATPALCDAAAGLGDIMSDPVMEMTVVFTGVRPYLHSNHSFSSMSMSMSHVAALTARPSTEFLLTRLRPCPPSILVWPDFGEVQGLRLWPSRRVYLRTAPRPPQDHAILW